MSQMIGVLVLLIFFFSYDKIFSKIILNVAYIFIVFVYNYKYESYSIKMPCSELVSVSQANLIFMQPFQYCSLIDHTFIQNHHFIAVKELPPLFGNRITTWLVLQIQNLLLVNNDHEGSA